MTAAIVTSGLLTLLITTAVAGPLVLRRAAPALAGTPRLAAVGLTAGALLWIATLLATGPVVAWFSSGPAWLPGIAAQVCSRCLAAAQPFADTGMQVGIPAVIPLALPFIGMILVIAGLARAWLMSWRSARATAHSLAPDSDRVTLFGHAMTVTHDKKPNAFSLPRRYGGIILTRGTLETLSTAELAAVIEHEHAHLRERHHLILLILNGITHFFRWIPLIAAIRVAVPHYLEMAADTAAWSVAGKRPLVTALIKLGTTPNVVPAALYASGISHASGTNRIRYLTGIRPTPASAAFAIATSVVVCALASVVASVHGPYLFAIASGC